MKRRNFLQLIGATLVAPAALAEAVVGKPKRVVCTDFGAKGVNGRMWSRSLFNGELSGVKFPPFIPPSQIDDETIAALSGTDTRASMCPKHQKQCDAVNKYLQEGFDEELIEVLAGLKR